MDDIESLKTVMIYIGPPLARLLSSVECTREAMEVGARIMSRLARDTFFVNTLAFSQVIAAAQARTSLIFSPVSYSCRRHTKY
jgi:uncharacterized membrane protein